MIDALKNKRRRTTAYSSIGIRRILCARCRTRRSDFQWQICADNRTFRTMCIECDIELNALVWDFMGFPDRDKVIDEYRRRKNREINPD